MKLILVGYPGSQKIRKASEYLINKYMPGFEMHWLNYRGDIDGWSEFVASHLRSINDKHIVFALDDYLLAAPLDQEKFDLLLANMDDDVVCARLCDSSFYTEKEIEGELIRVGYDVYTCTTQYCIWDREALINVLEQVNTPWEFELEGSGFMNRIDYRVIGTEPPALIYNTNSALSNRWEGVDLKCLNEEDTKKVKELL
jgi:hypothetical protein